MIHQTTAKSTFKLDANDLQQLLDTLHKNGYETVGPTLRESAITYLPIDSVKDLPRGWTDIQEPATYRVVKRNDDAFFGFNVAVQSWKRFLYPPVKKIFAVRKNGKSLESLEECEQVHRYAFIGVRPCELNAILIQDRVFSSNEYTDDSYTAIRNELFIVATNCTEAGQNCFCASMKTGTSARDGFDLALTEVIEEKEHFFIVEAGSEKGLSIIRDVATTTPTKDEIEFAADSIRGAESQSRKMELDGTAELLSANLEHPEWEEVAKRCLTCGNCTLVCPTCFCATVEDTTDLTGELAERARRWDSCFTLDFAKVAGGNFRTTARSRYRQWLTHKLSSWVDQFGVTGCVGCGRCITWCPVGIDITAEVQKIRET